MGFTWFDENRSWPLVLTQIVGRRAYYSNVKSFLSFADAQVIAVCDVDAWRLENGRNAVEQHYAKDQSSGAFRGCAAYRDFRDLPARADIDAVMISTPDHVPVPARAYRHSDGPKARVGSGERTIRQ